MLANKELSKFIESLHEDITSLVQSSEEGAVPEQIFTEIALDYLEEAGETENFRVCYDEKISGRGIEHKINGYAIHESLETIDIFVTVYNSTNTITTAFKSDIDKAISRAFKFLDNILCKNYLYELDESAEIFDFANSIYNSREIKENLSRINVFILSNHLIKSSFEPSSQIGHYKLFYRIIDLDYLFNLSDKTRMPIEINFREMGVPVPCITTNEELDGYQSYLAIIPGSALAHIYEEYGLRLLEQNVRSFLQFRGKINRGMRHTILEEPHMFMAFNNGIAATAEEINFENSFDGSKHITSVKDFQIVNGGQTTASIYHASKKYNADISKVYVQVKFTKISDKNNISTTIGRIAEYANTQNKITASDLSSNKSGLIRLEQISRLVWAPPMDGESSQTQWFFERAKGQYRNERINQGHTKSKQKSFDLKYPRKQVLTKEVFAKYVNAYGEIKKGNKSIIGPHIVVRGGQKNFAHFLRFNFNENPDEKYFQDSIAKVILFKEAEKIYGVKPHAIGDLRYVTVPYSISYLVLKTNNEINLYKIWKDQKLSDSFKIILKSVMLKIEELIKNNAPGSLYGEWAKKEDCWSFIKKQNIDINDRMISDYFTENTTRDSINVDKALLSQLKNQIDDIGVSNWKKLYLWARNTRSISQFYTDLCHTIGRKLQDDRSLSDREVYSFYLFKQELFKQNISIRDIISINK
ncbi:MAG: AIPR family protein [Balneolales bacterium]|nr:AIPR family protein [Balneolales bacterium]